MLVVSLHHGLLALAKELRSFLTSDDGQAIPEYALVTALFGFAAILSLVLVATTSATQLATTQNKVTNAALQVPAQ